MTQAAAGVASVCVASGTVAQARVAQAGVVVSQTSVGVVDAGRPVVGLALTCKDTLLIKTLAGGHGDVHSRRQ